MTTIRVHDILNEEVVAEYISSVCPRVSEQMVINGESYRVTTVDHYVDNHRDGDRLELVEVGVIYNV